MRFRNNGHSIHVDFAERDIPWMENVIKYALGQSVKQFLDDKDQHADPS